MCAHYIPYLPSSLHCLHILRNADFNHYIACLFAPSKKRAALATIWAFHVEISKIVEQVTEPLIGEIRLRWWCDEIEKIALEHFPKSGNRFLDQKCGENNKLEQFVEPSETKTALEQFLKSGNRLSDKNCGENKELEQKSDTIESHSSLATNHSYNEKQNPLLFALTQTIEHYKLPVRPFIAAIEARIGLLYDQNLSPLTPEFNLYVQETTGLFFQLSCQILDSTSHEKIAATCYHAAQTETLWRHWRWQKTHSAAGHHTPSSDEQIIAAIMHHYHAFAGLITQLPRTFRPAFLSLAPMKSFDGSDDDLSSLRRLWLIVRTALFSKFQ